MGLGMVMYPASDSGVFWWASRVDKREVLAMMYIETQFYDSGKACATLHSKEPTVIDTNICDVYVESIGTGGDYESFEAWTDELVIDVEDVEMLLLDLTAGKTVDISGFC